VGSTLFAFTALGQRVVRAAGSPGLTTHMLDTASGKPAEGVKIDFSVLEGEAYRFVKTVHTNADGRNAEPLLTEEIQFGMADATSHYHVPLLASPWSFTTYRGS
jgi:5-hydroxyisourate hydrolase